MALSKDDVLNAIAEMSVMDIVELISDMEEKFGVTAAVAAAPAAAGAYCKSKPLLQWIIDAPIIVLILLPRDRSTVLPLVA